MFAHCPVNRASRLAIHVGGCLALAPVLPSTTACQSTKVARSGYLTSYQGLPRAERAPKDGAQQHRDDVAADQIQRVFIALTVLMSEIETEFSEEEKAMILGEVDRQLCFEVSERFIIAPAPMSDAATVRTGLYMPQVAGTSISKEEKDD